MPSSTHEVRTSLQYQSGGPVRQAQDVTSDDEDIYRGDPPVTLASSSSISLAPSSSSSGSILAGGRLGAIAAVVEQAISRWARGRSSASSESASSASILTVPRSQSTRRRRKQRPSLSNLQNLQSERDITARIRAREEFRGSPREFALYLPPSHGAANKNGTVAKGDVRVLPIRDEGIPFTTSLPLVLDRLDQVMKKSIKARYNQNRNRTHKARDHLPHHHYMLLDDLHSRSPDLAVPSANKKKQKDVIASKSQTCYADDGHVWWLDVSSPTWEDMRAIGKLLHLHPLTLEDILHQDPREKLEHFTRLGYYFIVFRAIESSKTRERFIKETADGDTNTLNEGMLGASLVYMVVFWDGICTFHFSDISEHVGRVKNRLLRVDRTVRTSPDWIAYGILDSIVDSFSPYLEEVEKEVLKMEDLVFSESGQGNANTGHTDIRQPSSPPPQSMHMEKVECVIVNEKSGQTPKTNRNIFSIIRPFPGVQSLRQFQAFIHSILVSMLLIRESKSISTTATLRRLTKTRRLVTSLTRLLATKSEVVAQIRKRFLTQNWTKLENGKSKSEDLDVAIHMGDVQDHILSLQFALNHYERTLSQSHPTYLSQLSINVAQVKSGSDKAVMTLTIISMAMLCLQIPIGVLSLNVQLPANNLVPDGPYNIFYMVIAFSILLIAGYLSVVRWWWVRSKKKQGAMFK